MKVMEFSCSLEPKILSTDFSHLNLTSHNSGCYMALIYSSPIAIIIFLFFCLSEHIFPLVFLRLCNTCLELFHGISVSSLTVLLQCKENSLVKSAKYIA